MILLQELETRKEKQTREQARGCVSQLPTSTPCLGEGLRQPLAMGETRGLGWQCCVHCCCSSLPGSSALPFPQKSRIR